MILRAGRLYKHIVKTSEERSSEDKTFQFIKSWFENLIKRYSLHNTKLVAESASTDREAAEFQWPLLLMVIGSSFPESRALLLESC
jgi:hypothetical protein